MSRIPHFALRTGVFTVAAAISACLLALCIWTGRTARASVATGPHRRATRIRFAFGDSFLARPGSALRPLPAEQSGTRARCKDLRGDQEDRSWPRCAWHLALTPWRSSLRRQFMGRHSIRDRHQGPRSCRHLAGGCGAVQCRRRSLRQAPLRGDRISNDVAVLDARTGAELKRLAAGRGASYITPSPDGARLYVTHVYPNTTPHRTAPDSEITVIDTARAVVAERIPLPYIAHTFHIAFSADGRLGVAAGLHPKNLVPLAHLEHGGAFADTLTLFGGDVGKPVEVPLDDLERYSARPFAVAITPTSPGSLSPAEVPRPLSLSIFRDCFVTCARIPGRRRRIYQPLATM